MLFLKLSAVTQVGINKWNWLINLNQFDLANLDIYYQK